MQSDGFDKSEIYYLDLVNSVDGNAVVTTEQNITIYWPYPTEVLEDAKQTAGENGDYLEEIKNNDIFEIIHLKGLDREYTVTNNNSYNINADNVETFSGEEITLTEYGIKFTTESFSPFVLLWKAKNNIVTPDIVTPQPEQPGGDNTVEEENVDQVNNPDPEEPTEEDEYLDDSTVENVNSDNTEDTNDITEEDEVDKTESIFPGTGDTADVVRWILIMLICAAGAIVLLKLAVRKIHQK
jgi:hypothetical protein